MRSARRGNTGGAFSLFAFQDILTTTIGVVLLILLVLILNITLTTVTTAVTTAEDVKDTPQLDEAQLQEQIELKSRILSMLDDVPFDSILELVQDETMRKQATINRLLASLQNQRLAAARDEADKRSEITELDGQIVALSVEIESKHAELKEGNLDSEEIKELLELRAERGRLKKKMEGEQANDELVYISQKGAISNPIFVEISDGKIEIHSQGSGNGMPIITLALDKENMEERIDATVNLLQQLCPKGGKSYPLLLVKPELENPYLVWELRGKLTELEGQGLIEKHGPYLLNPNQKTTPDSLLPGGIP